MVYSEAPSFVFCAGGEDVAKPDGVAGMPTNSKFVQEAQILGAWKPPRLGQLISSVSRGPDGSIWAVHRSPKILDKASFDPQAYPIDSEPIDGNVVAQLDPTSGMVSGGWEVLQGFGWKLDQVRFTEKSVFC